MVIRKLIITLNIWTLLWSERILRNHASFNPLNNFLRWVSSFPFYKWGRRFTYTVTEFPPRKQESVNSLSEMRWMNAVCGSVHAQEKENGSETSNALFLLRLHANAGTEETMRHHHAQGRAWPWLLRKASQCLLTCSVPLGKLLTLSVHLIFLIHKVRIMTWSFRLF